MSLKRLFVITGDASGDVHGSVIIRRLQQAMPHTEIHAIGGEKIESTGVLMLEHQQKMGVFGLGVLSAIPSHYQLGQRILNHFKSWQPDAVLLIDYGMFNLWIAKQLQGSGIKVFYYIPPQIWASRRGRIRKIKRYVDHVFGIFPFEEELYRSHGVPFTFVGHPLMEQLPPPPDKIAFCRQHQLDPDLPIIGIFPGSRRLEIKGLLQPMIQALPRIQEISGQRFQFLLARSAGVSDAFFNSVFDPVRSVAEGVSFKILTHHNHEILSLSQAILAASGTVTLEAALYQTPAVIAYKLSRFSYELFRRFIYVNHIGLPNLLSKNPQGFLPELLMENVTPEKLAQAIHPYLYDSPQRQQAEQEFATIRQKLGDTPASVNVVQALASLMQEPFVEPIGSIHTC